MYYLVIKQGKQEPKTMESCSSAMLKMWAMFNLKGKQQAVLIDGEKNYPMARYKVVNGFPKEFPADDIIVQVERA